MALKKADEMCASLQVSKRSLLEWVRRGKIPVVKLGPKTLRFDEDAVIAALKSAVVGAEKGEKKCPKNQNATASI